MVYEGSNCLIPWNGIVRHVGWGYSVSVVNVGCNEILMDIGVIKNLLYSSSITKTLDKMIPLYLKNVLSENISLTI